MDKKNEKQSIKSYISKLTAISLISLAFFWTTPGVFASKAEAVQIFTPFGGKVATWVPEAPGCGIITAAISIATLFTVNVTIEELILENHPSDPLGILRVDGLTIPGLTTIFKKYLYQAPGTWVLGNSLNICDVCGKFKDVPIAGLICEVEPIKTAMESVCSIVSDGTQCPITNLVHYMGVGGPPIGK